jgi:hypothetical protein
MGLKEKQLTAKVFRFFSLFEFRGAPKINCISYPHLGSE